MRPTHRHRRPAPHPPPPTPTRPEQVSPPPHPAPPPPPPPASLILVTGASGHIAGHIVHEALLAGYRVRGTARTAAKCAHTQQTYAQLAMRRDTKR